MIIILIATSYMYYEQNQTFEDSFVLQILDKCSFIVDCAIDELQTLSQKESEKTILDTFDGLLLTYNESLPFCHEYGHQMGLFIYNYLDDASAALSHVDANLCGGSTYHEIIQTHMLSELNEHKNPSEIDIKIICTTTPDNPQSRTRGECLHGIGHGLTTIYNYDVLTAVNGCKQFKEGWEQMNCSKGLFMENVVNYAYTEVVANNNDLFFPCNQIEDSIAPACYHFHAIFLLNFDLKNIDSFSKCDKAPKEFVKYCYRGLGSALAEKVYKENNTTCQLIPYEYQTDCHMGIVSFIADQSTPQNALQFCKTIPDEFKSDCYGEVGKWIKMVYSDDVKRKQECAKSENLDLTEICNNSSLDGIRIL